MTDLEKRIAQNHVNNTGISLFRAKNYLKSVLPEDKQQSLHIAFTAAVDALQDLETLIKNANQ